MRRDLQAVLEADQQVDVDERPQQPSQTAFELPFAEIEYRGVAADDRGVAAIVKAEWFVQRTAARLGCKQPPYIGALLRGDLRQRRQRLAVPIERRRAVSEHIDVRQVGY